MTTVVGYVSCVECLAVSFCSPFLSVNELREHDEKIVVHLG